jgi:hypothetical protein
LSQSDCTAIPTAIVFVIPAFAMPSLGGWWTNKNQCGNSSASVWNSTSPFPGLTLPLLPVEKTLLPNIACLLWKTTCLKTYNASRSVSSSSCHDPILFPSPPAFLETMSPMPQASANATHTIGSWWLARSNHCCQLKDRSCKQSTVTRLGRKRKACSCRSKDVQQCSAQLRGLIPESSLQ